jgi:hypothetical protein
MNTNTKLVLMGIAAAVVANKVLAPAFAGLAPVQQRPTAAYGGTVLGAVGVAALLWKHSPKGAALAAGAAGGMAMAGYQAGAYSASNLQAAPGQAVNKILPASTPAGSKVGVLAPGGGFGNAGPNGTVVFNPNPVPTNAGGEGGFQNITDFSGGDGGLGKSAESQQEFDKQLKEQVEGSGGDDGGFFGGFFDQAGLATRNQAGGRASRLHYG